MSTRYKVLVIGGYGEFGGRLVELLLRDKHEVWVAGRHLDKAQAFCRAKGGTPLQFDRAGNLSGIAVLLPDVVIDASGPYQGYGSIGERYRLVEATLLAGAHYLDLSDDGEFTRDIQVMNGLALQHKRFALSGVSSTPALSSAAVFALSGEMSSIEKIETTILPGAKAPQGNAVMQAILNQVGNPIRFWRCARWVIRPGWSESVVQQFGNTLQRRASLISTADTELFPGYFNAKSVLFRAGLSMPIMQRSLESLGWLRQRGCLPNLVKLLKPLSVAADMLTPFGNDTGGMLVEVTGPSKQTHSEQKTPLIQRRWTLLAEPDQGPYIPGIAARAVLRNIDQIPVGARACLNEVSLTLLERAMQDLDVSTVTSEHDFDCLFPKQLHDQWHKLPQEIVRTHEFADMKILSGEASVVRGQSIAARIIAALFRFPPATPNTPVTVTKTRYGDKEIWQRNFNGKPFQSTLAPTDTAGVVTERFGWLTFRLNLPVDETSLGYKVVSGHCLGIPIPLWLLPTSNTQENVENGKMHFSVELIAPLKLGLLVHYRGWLQENHTPV